MNKLIVTLISAAVVFTACNRNAQKFDASGTFEVDEVIVSAEQSGKLLSFNVSEGQTIPKENVVGIIDAENLSLQKEQVQASIQALHEKTADVLPQIKLLPTGGVNLQNCISFFEAGASGIGIGGQLFDKDYISKKDWPALAGLFASFASKIKPIIK